MMNRYVVYGCAFMVREVEFEDCCNVSPVSTSVALIKYPVMMPFLSWGRGRIHVRRMERGEVATARKFWGKPLGTKGEQSVKMWTQHQQSRKKKHLSYFNRIFWVVSVAPVCGYQIGFLESSLRSFFFSYISYPLFLEDLFGYVPTTTTTSSQGAPPGADV